MRLRSRRTRLPTADSTGGSRGWSTSGRRPWATRRSAVLRASLPGEYGAGWGRSWCSRSWCTARGRSLCAFDSFRGVWRRSRDPPKFIDVLDLERGRGAGRSPSPRGGGGQATPPACAAPAGRRAPPLRRLQDAQSRSFVFPLAPKRIDPHRNWQKNARHPEGHRARHATCPA
jgi:hypothetical protein